MPKVLVPILDRVIVKVIDQEKVTKGGIILPDNAQKRGCLKGVVLAIGPGRWHESGQFVTPGFDNHPESCDVPLTFGVGDTVIFGKYAGSQYVEREGAGSDELVILIENDILAVEKDDG